MIQEGSNESRNQASNLKWLRLSPIFILSCSMLTLVKLWLVRRDEMPCTGSPFDDIWYMQSAKDWYWLRSYDQLPFGTPPYIRLPAYPLYLAVVNLTGVPLRIMNELLLMVAAFVFAWVLIKAGQSPVLGILFFAATIFHPGSLHVNSIVFADSFYAAVLLFSLAGLILLLLKREDPHRLWYALATGIALAVLWHVRQESIIILGFLGVYALLWFLNVRGESLSRISKLKQFTIVVATPLLVILLVSVVVSTANYKRFGVFSGDAMFTSDFAAASKALVRIKPQVPIRFVPVPREVRQRAYVVSPAFKELESYFEGDTGRTWATFGKDVGVQVPGEISAGHFWWGLNQATYYAGYNKSGRRAGRFYRRMAAEINAACDDGRLECRPVISASIDPARQNWLPYLPQSFSRMTHMFIAVEEPPKPQELANLGPDLRQLVDYITNRRAAFLNGPRITTHRQSLLWSYHGKLIVLLSYLGVGALLLLLICYRSLNLKDPVFTIVTLLIAVIAIRLALATLIDASAFYVAPDIRYLFPVMYLYTCVLLLLIAQAISVVSSRVNYQNTWRKITAFGRRSRD